MQEINHGGGIIHQLRKHETLMRVCTVAEQVDAASAAIASDDACVKAGAAAAVEAQVEADSGAAGV